MGGASPAGSEGHQGELGRCLVGSKEFRLVAAQEGDRCLWQAGLHAAREDRNCAIRPLSCLLHRHAISTLSQAKESNWP